MKLSFIILAALLVGCMKPIPPQPPAAIVVTVQPIHDLPKVKGVVVVEDTPVDPPLHTWLTQEDIDKMAAQRLQDAMETAIKKDSCMCHPGDPLCSCLDD